MNRRTFVQRSAVISTAICTGLAPEPVFGHGDFRYRLDRRWCQADPGRFPVKNCHELAMDKRGRIFMTTDDTRNNILVFNGDGVVVEAWGKEYPGAHGLTLHDENGEEFLYITDYERHEVYKTTLDGRVIRAFGWPADSGKYQSANEFCPTETAIAPNGDVFIADGYGKDFVVQYDQQGVLKNCFGGKDLLKNAHGIALDTRKPNEPAWLVTSRAENALHRFSLDGRWLEKIELPGAYICRPVIKGENVYFAVLVSKMPWDSASGFVCILDKNNRMVSAPGANVPRYDSDSHLNTMYQTVQIFRHPHDVLVDPDDNILVTQWNSGQVYPVKLNRTA